MADESIFRIMVATDNHLGFKEYCPNRSSESFNVFEEVLIVARQLKVDLVLLAGDLFDLQRPSQYTTYRCTQLLRTYVRGSTVAPKRFDVERPSLMYEDGEGVETEARPLNFELDEKIKLPVFIIHGNHDPPGGGAPEFISPIDILEASGLVNNIGKVADLDNIQVSPVCLKKGQSRLCLYGVGHIRDERMHRLMKNGRVKFLRPNTDEEYFNILMLHQNRYKGNAQGVPLKNSLKEEALPTFLDFVIWGHEHDCLINPRMSAGENFHIIQPGSSLVTSLSKGESAMKHVCILEVCGSHCRVHPIPLLSSRPLIFKDLVLEDHPELPDKSDEAVWEFLRHEARGAIHEADMFNDERLALWESNMDSLLRAVARTEGDDTDDEGAFPKDKRKFLAMLHSRIRGTRSNANTTIEKPLLRLRVDHSHGYPTIPNPKFGSEFFEEFANPEDILAFTQKKQAKHGSGNTRDVPILEVDPETSMDDSQTLVSAFDLVFKHIEGNNSLELISEPHFNLAIRHFVDRTDSKEPELIVVNSRNAAKAFINQEVPLGSPDLEVRIHEAVLRFSSQVRESAFQLTEDTTAEGMPSATTTSQPTSSQLLPKRKRAALSSQGSNSSDVESTPPPSTQRKKSKLLKPLSSSEDEEESFSAKPAAKAKAKPKAKSRSRRVV